MEPSVTHKIDGEYIREWLILGPFFSDDMDNDFLADEGGEANIHPQEGDTITAPDGKILTWKRYKSEKDVVDMIDAVGNYEHVTAYVFCILECENEGDVQIYLANDDDAMVWIDGKQIFSDPGGNFIELDQHSFNVDLRAGNNRCLIKIANQEGRWRYAIRILPTEYADISGTIKDENGEPAAKASVYLEQNGKIIAETSANDNGIYHLGVCPSHGMYDLCVTKFGSNKFGNWELGIKLDGGERRKLDITLRENVSIAGSVFMLDEEKTPHVAIVTQALYISDAKPFARSTVITDSQGKYQFFNLRPGKYIIRCQISGGYIYYRNNNDEALSMTPYDADIDYNSDILNVEMDKTLGGINLRIAPFKRGTWRSLSYFDGLPHDSTSSICSSPDGMLWFTTRGGISRYDGSELVNFTTKDGLAHNEVNACYVDTDGTMWFGTKGGVSHFDGKAFANFTVADGLAGNYISSIFRDSEGNMWFGAGDFTTPGNGLSRYDGEDFINFTIADGLPHNTVYSICCDNDGVLWVGTEWGVCWYNGERFIKFDKFDDQFIVAIHFDPDGVMWFISLFRIWRYDGNELVTFDNKDGLLNDHIYAFHKTPDGAMWFGAWNGVSRYDGKGFTNFTSKDGLACDTIQAIYNTPDGVMWFGTSLGISRYDSTTLTKYTARDGLAGGSVNAIYNAPDGVIWIATSNGFYRYDKGKFLVTLDAVRATDIRLDSKGDMWVAEWTGKIHRYVQGGIAETINPQGMVYYTFCWDSHGLLWIGTWRSAVCFDGEKSQIFNKDNGLAGNYVPCIIKDSNDNLWIATHTGVSRYSDGKFDTPLTAKDGLAADYVLTIYDDSSGNLWFGTMGGVSCYDGKIFTNYTVEDGLTHNHVNAIHISSKGDLWFGTRGGGVARYDGIAWSSLDARDGLGNNINCIQENKDGTICFGTTEEGYIQYHPDEASPKARITSVETDREYTDLQSIPPIGTGDRVIIRFSSIDFKTLPEKRQYRYYIKEIDSDWRKPVKTNYYEHVFNEPGKYTFEVQAIDRDLNYSEPVSLELEIVLDPRSRRIIQLEEHIHKQELAEIERMQMELEDARQIQQSLLPDKPPVIKDFEIASISSPAKEVSGDFYSYLSLGDGAGIVLADVTGKSVKAAMVAALGNGTLNAEVEANESIWNSPAEILRRLNLRLQPHLIRGMYIAMSLGILRTEQKQLILSNAGMPYSIIKRGDKAWELEVSGMPLGLVSEAEYQDICIDLEKDDLVIFCSDGVIEAENEAGEMYQTEGLLKTVQNASLTSSAQGMVDLILRDVTAFVGNEEPSDDITIVVLKCKG